MIGKKVRLSEKYKSTVSLGSLDHVQEFGNSVGVVEGLVDYGSCQGPEVDVRWDGKFRYAYNPDDLEVIEMNITKEMASTIIIALSVAEHESQIDVESAKEIVAEIVRAYPELQGQWYD